MKMKAVPVHAVQTTELVCFSAGQYSRDLVGIWQDGMVGRTRQDGMVGIRQDRCHAVLEQSSLRVWDCLWTLQKLALPRCKSQKNEKHWRLLQTFHFLGPLQCFHFTTGDLGISSFFEMVMPCLQGSPLNQCPVTVETLEKCGHCSVSILSQMYRDY